MLATTQAVPRDVVHLTKHVATQPRTFEETMFQMEDIGISAAHDDLDDLEVDHDYFNLFIPTLLRPDTPIGTAVRNSAHIVSSAAAAATKKGSFNSLRHEYISINLDNQEFIVDPSFKDHFVVQNPTTRYAAILNLVPDTVVVAPRRQLLRAVALLATELQRCFEARKVPLPPWRRLSSLMSKWVAASQVVVTTHRAVAAMAALSDAPAPAMPIMKTSTKLPAGTHAVAHSFPKASLFSPQSILESQGRLETGLRANSKTYVGFHTGIEEDECFCCGSRRRMLKRSTQQDMTRVPHSAPAA
ncbi:hypothetical protein NADE_000497 [Nannochloris sp. 'desiccata']|nr:hypothetical protein KSW81_004738 [Chlorella desiccata (nom. nud.)]KAH7618302.1 hypothetical protein NADE_000497 [Chlorella desiccata (nom. nud.)]